MNTWKSITEQSVENKAKQKTTTTKNLKLHQKVNICITKEEEKTSRKMAEQ